MRFILNEKDFESIKSNIPGTQYWIEITKISEVDYSVFIHRANGSVYENGTYTKEELKTIWKMLSVK